MRWSFAFQAIALSGSLILACPADIGAQNKSEAAALKDAVDRAANDPNFDYESAVDSLQRAGLTDDALAAGIQQVQEAWAKAKAQRGKDQNASGTADWNIGLVYRGDVYSVKFPLTNNCRVPVEVTIRYPESIPLTGPETVTVPAKSTVEVAMKISFKGADNPPPPGPWPIGVNWSCVPEDDALLMKHSQVAGGTKVTPAGKWTYVCDMMRRAYTMHLHLHWHDSSDDKNKGGGGGKPKGRPNKSRACQTLWNYGEFFPDAARQTPNECRSEVLDMIHGFMDKQLPALRANKPGAWKWMPDAATIDQMPIEELLALKAQAGAAATATGTN